MRYVMETDERKNLTELLRNGIIEVTFTKVDGSERVLNCTLQTQYLPESIEKEGIKVKNEDVQSVWDIDNNGWRSFRFDSVKEFRVI
jgi:hypothetical protein